MPGFAYSSNSGLEQTRPNETLLKVQLGVRPDEDVIFIWIPSVSITPWMQSFITWDSICIRWHPNLASLIPNINLSLFKVCITFFSFPESRICWLFPFTSLLFCSWSKLLVLDFRVAPASSGTSLGASNIFTRAFDCATSAARWILRFSNYSDFLFSIYPASAISSAILIHSSSVFFSLGNLLLALLLHLPDDLLWEKAFADTDCLELRCACLSASASFI